MILRPATFADAARLYEWRNAPEVRAASLTTEDISFADHLAWLTSTLGNQRRRLYVAESTAGVPLGTGRLDLNETGLRADVSLTLAPRERGKGLAKPLLAALTEEARQLGVTHCAAWVRPESIGSLAAFTSAGFRGEPVRLVLTPETWAMRLCEHCAAGAPHHTNALTSIGGGDRHVVRDLHEVEDSGGVGLAECLAAELWR